MTGPAREGGAGEAAWLAWSDAEETNLTPCSDAFLAGWKSRGAADAARIDTYAAENERMAAAAKPNADARDIESMDVFRRRRSVAVEMRGVAAWVRSLDASAGEEAG